MMVQMTMERQKAYVELLEVLKRVDQNLINKIPKDLIKFFNDNKSQEYTYTYNDEKTLEEQNLNNITLSLLAMLNLNYWCESEEHKQELLAQYKENEEKYQEELREKYNPDNIFKDKQEKSIPVAENMQMVSYKESIFKRIINKIKTIFNIG